MAPHSWLVLRGQHYHKVNNCISLEGEGDSSALGRFGSSFSWHLSSCMGPGSSTALPVTWDPTTVQVSRLRAYLQHPTSTTSVGLARWLQTRRRPQRAGGCQWPGSCSVLSSSLRGLRNSSASETPPGSNLAQVLWIGKTLNFNQIWDKSV